VLFNGATRQATFVSSIQLAISLSTTDLATAGTYSVVVTNPAPGGGASNSVDFTVTNSQAKNEFLYVAFDSPNLGDIAGFLINPSSGKLQSTGSVLATGGNVYSMAADPQGKFLSLGTTDSSGQPNTSGVDIIENLAINSATGMLTAGTSQVNIGARGYPFYIAVDPTGQFIYSAFKGGGPGIVGTYGINKTTGVLSAIDGSSSGGGAGIAASPVGEYFATSDSSGALDTYQTLNTGNLVSPYSQSSSVGVMPAGVAIDSTGSFAYTANTGSGTISGYLVSSSAGLTPLSGSPYVFGTTPRSIVISPSGTLLFVSDDTGQVGVFMRNTSSGALTLQSTTHLSGWPTSGVINSYLALDSTGQYLYVISTGGAKIYAFEVDPSTGALTAIQGSPYVVASETKAAALAVVQEK
jgi:6-phosphogluconolactonase (cycloisomerase 2 family)